MAFNGILEQTWRKCLALLLSPEVSELEINGPDQFFIKRNGRRQRIPISLDNEKSYLEFIEDCVVKETDYPDFYEANSSIFESRLRYSAQSGYFQARCHIVLPPAAEVPQVTIAKKSQELTSLEAIAAKGTMSQIMKDFLQLCVESDLTIGISGGTGSGKTTLLEALTAFFRKEDRIGVAEDTPELNLKQENVSYLHSVPAKPGRTDGSVELSWIVQQFQRMRVDKLIIGETRGKEFADFLTAANSGMEGSLTTIHANNPILALQKMTNFALKGSERQPIRSINKDIANSIDLIVQIGVFPGEGHKILAIQEITSTVGPTEDAQITTQTLYNYDRNRNLFLKAANMTEELRNKFLNKNAKFERFLEGPPGTILKDDFSRSSSQSNFGGRSGIPMEIGGTRKI